MSASVCTRSMPGCSDCSKFLQTVADSIYTVWRDETRHHTRTSALEAFGDDAVYKFTFYITLDCITGTNWAHYAAINLCLPNARIAYARHCCCKPTAHCNKSRDPSHWRSLPPYTTFTRYNWLSNRYDNRFDNRVEQTATVRSTGCQTGLYIVKPVVKRVWQPFECLYTRYNRLSNRFDSRLYRVYSQLSNRRLSNRLLNRFDNQLYRVNGVFKAQSFWCVG